MSRFTDAVYRSSTVIFPPAAIPIAIMLNGAPLQSYNQPYVLQGRIEAPIAPYITRIADRIAYSGGTMIITRGSSEVRIRVGIREPRSLQAVYVPLATILRRLGARASYDAARRVLEVHVEHAGDLATMPPFVSSHPQGRPIRVFTPEPVASPRPVYTGSPHPRRTPIIITTSRP
ncbi:MAG: hypothetical protein M3N19_01280 [Candidatus Eremiobacteraeota bacterium]|nr:hypothetical protein [Candidatus Eremiobacteraeota bacterium]